MSLLKHIFVSIIITIIVAWRFPQFGLQLAFESAWLQLLYGFAILTISVILLLKFKAKLPFTQILEGFNNMRTDIETPLIIAQFFINTYLLISVAISWIIFPNEAHFTQIYLIYYLCCTIISFGLSIIQSWFEDIC